MKRLLLASLSTLALAIATPAYSQNISVTTQNQSPNVTEITPFDLVYQGYHGYFQDKGIPSNGAFLNAINSGKVHVIDLVKIAIEQGRLAPEASNDRTYLHAVQSQLDELDRN